MKILCVIFSAAIFLCLTAAIASNFIRGNVSGAGTILALGVAWLSYRAMRLAIADLKRDD